MKEREREWELRLGRRGKDRIVRVRGAGCGS